MSEINNHRRVNDILLGPLERPTLQWLAARTPDWITPDTYTLLGILGSVGTSASYILSTHDSNFLWLASLGFAVNWIGDSMDGTLARYRHIERPIFGFFVDHTVDAFSVSIIVLGLGLTEHVSFNIACLTLIAYLLMSVLVFVRTSAVGEFKISFSKLGPTEIRVLAVILNTIMYFGGPRQMFRWDWGALGELTLSPYDFIVMGIALLLLYFFFVTAIRETLRLARENK